MKFIMMMAAAAMAVLIGKVEGSSHLNLRQEKQRKLPVNDAGCSCETETPYPFVADGGEFETSIEVGCVGVSEGVSEVGSYLQICFDIGDLTPNDQGDDSSPTLVTKLNLAAGCSVSDIPQKNGNPIVGKFDLEFVYAEGTDSACEKISKPNCDYPIVAVHADVEKLGMADFLDVAFPVDVNFMVTTDPGSDVNASYFDTLFNGGLLDGQLLNGYCVDTGRTIQLNSWYTGVAYIDDLPGGSIDKPDNLDLVAWLINNYDEGTTYISPGTDIFSITCGKTLSFPGSYAMTSGTMQRAIWYLIDDNQSTSGLGAYNQDWACYLADEAFENGNGFVPGCGHVFPLILVPNTNAQRTIGQTTIVELGVPCETIGETAWAAMPLNGDLDYGLDFPGKNWATYIKYDSINCPSE